MIFAYIILLFNAALKLAFWALALTAAVTIS